jgi:hypothetical protein
MNGIHEVTGSIPVWSTILRSPSASFGSVNQPHTDDSAREPTPHGQFGSVNHAQTDNSPR